MRVLIPNLVVLLFGMLGAICGTSWAADLPAVAGDEFMGTQGERLIDDPLKRAFLQRDLWAVFDHLAGQNIARYGDGDLLRRGALDREGYGSEPDEVPFDDPEAMQRRAILCRKLAVIIQRLALPQAVIQALPDNYAAAIRSGQFALRHDFDCQSNYLPPGLLTRADEWVEIDTSPEPLTRHQQEGQIDYVAWSIRGRSYYRIFWRFPGGRKAVEAYLKHLREDGADWGKTARQGHIWKEKVGVHSLNSVFCFAPNGGMPGIVIPMGFGDIRTFPRPQRTARWKARQEDYLRLVEYARAGLPNQ